MSAHFAILVVDVEGILILASAAKLSCRIVTNDSDRSSHTLCAFTRCCQGVADHHLLSQPSSHCSPPAHQAQVKTPWSLSVYSMRTNPANAIAVNVKLVRPTSFTSPLNVGWATNACWYLDTLGIGIAIQAVANVNGVFDPFFVETHHASKTQLLHDEDEDQR